MKNQNSRVEGKTVKVKRQDIRIPIDFYNRLKQIAVERFNAHVHHRSGEPTITPTLLKLAELGIEYIESGLADKKTEIFSTEVFKRLENNESNHSDSNTDKLAENLINRLEKLERNLNDINDDIYNHKLPERIDSIEQHLNRSNTDKTIQELEQKIELLEKNLTDNNNDTKALKEQLSSFSQQFTNTDKSPLDYFEKPTKPDNPEINNTDIQPILEQQIEVGSDNSNDIYNDNNLNFLDSVKEAFSSENDPDTNPTIEDYPAVEASTKANIVSDEPITVTEETGLTDKELADEFGVNPSMVKRWRTGTSKPRGNNLKRFKQWEIRQNRWYKIKL